MIANDKEYRITRYWRNVFHKAANQYLDFEQNAIDMAMVASYLSMDVELSEEMEVYLTKTEKKDADFPKWTPEESGETAVLIECPSPPCEGHEHL